MGLHADATDLLQRLIRLDTVNPPGRERPAIDLLAEALSAAGFECEERAAEPDRPNLVARLKGAAPGPVLGYLGHVDTVLADPDEWQHSPWSGDVIDGELWGRGAIDMKSQVAAEVAAAITLARSGWRPAQGELKVFCVADEEAGGELGAFYLTQEHPELAYADYIVNEGAGSVIEWDGAPVWGVSVAEKGVMRFVIRTRGVAGHASIPALSDNALLKMGPLLERFATRSPGRDLTDEPLAFLGGLGIPSDDIDAALDRVRETEPRLLPLLLPMLGATFAPTKISASEKINVVPARAELRVDCRVPPGFGPDLVERRIADVLGDVDGWELEFTEQVIGNRSPLETPLMDAIREWLGEVANPGRVVPTVLPGFTDSRSWRTAFPDCVAYGFFPHRHSTIFDTSPLIHGKDERIDVRDLGFAADFFAWLAPRMLGTA